MPAGDDGATTRFPVSAKGIVVRDGRVVLVRNPRDEWELPGGKLEAGETVEACVARELGEELGRDVAVGPVVDAWVYRIAPGTEVLVVACACEPRAWPERLESPEGAAIGLFAEGDLDALPLPEGYRRAIRLRLAMR